MDCLADGARCKHAVLLNIPGSELEYTVADRGRSAVPEDAGRVGKVVVMSEGAETSR